MTNYWARKMSYNHVLVSPITILLHFFRLFGNLLVRLFTYFASFFLWWFNKQMEYELNRQSMYIEMKKTRRIKTLSFFSR